MCKLLHLKIGMRVNLWMPYMFILVLMTLTVMQVHSGSAKAKQSALHALGTQQAISIKTFYNGRPFFRDLDLDFANVYMACHLFFFYMTLTLKTFIRLDHLFSFRRFSRDSSSDGNQRPLFH